MIHVMPRRTVLINPNQFFIMELRKFLGSKKLLSDSFGIIFYSAGTFRILSFPIANISKTLLFISILGTLKQICLILFPTGAAMAPIPSMIDMPTLARLTREILLKTLL
jgi:hypothetical protein